MKKLILILLIMVLSISIVACSSNDSDKGINEKDQNTNIILEHSAGTTVLEKPAKKVVVLEWIYGEDMLALGVQPVGMTDIKGYHQWMNSGEINLNEDVVDLGTRGSANLEDIAALEPDLIITTDYYEYDYELLNAIAPTVVLTPYPGESDINGEYNHMIDSINLLGSALGLEDKANEVINNLEAKYKEANTLLKDTDVNFNYIELIDFSTNDTVSMFLFTDSSIHTTILEKIGFTNMYKPEKFEGYGQTNINIENLIGLDDNTVFIVADKGSDIFSKDLISKNILDGLEFYKNNNLYYLGSNASPFGPLSTLTFVDTIVDSVQNHE